MRTAIARLKFLQKLTISQRFLLASLVILVCGMSGIGWWVGQQIESGVIHQSAATTALYVESFIEPHLQSLRDDGALTQEDQAALSGLLEDTQFGQEIVAFKVWGREGRVTYSTDPALTGQVFPVGDDLKSAWRGWVSAEMSNLTSPENVDELKHWDELLEIYTPVRLRGSDDVIAVAEFYQTTDNLRGAINEAQQQSWLIVALATLLMYLLMAGFVSRTSRTIEKQQRDLGDQVTQLKRLLGQNEALNEQVRRSAGRTAALNERFLRRIGAELHDGPAQDLGLALLRLDHVAARAEDGVPNANGHVADGDDLNVVQGALQHALREIRSISAGLSLPHLDQVTLGGALTAAVRGHARRTGTLVTLEQEDLPAEAPLPVKIAAYRVVQEALNNAYRHANGVGQKVTAHVKGDELYLEVIDKGPGWSANGNGESEVRLGLEGMRERVQSLAGSFSVEGDPGQGTVVRAMLPLANVEANSE